MKKVSLIIVACMISVASYAQNTEFMKFFDRYSQDESFTVVSVNQRMIGLLSNIEVDGEDEKAFMEAVTKLKGIKLIAKEDTPEGQKFYQEAKKAFDKSYDELMSIRDGGSDMRFLIKESGGKISELVMLVGSDSSFVAASLFGEIDLKNISKLAKGMKIDGMEHLEKLDEKED
jgi:hypothetical protein